MTVRLEDLVGPNQVLVVVCGGCLTQEMTVEIDPADNLVSVRCVKCGRVGMTIGGREVKGVIKIDVGSVVEPGKSKEAS